MKKHAYLIMAHNNPEQLKMLVDLLDDERNDIFVMIDKKSPIAPFRCITTKQAGFQLVKRRINIYWGHHSQIQAEFTLLKTAMKFGHYSYMHLLSGSDLPLVSQNAIHEFFEQHIGSEFVDFQTETSDFQDVADKSEYPFYFGKYLYQDNWFSNVIGKRLFDHCRRWERRFGWKHKHTIKLIKGSQWFSITSDFAQWLILNEQFAMKQLKWTWCSDELLIPSLLSISPYKNNIHPSGNMRAIDWHRGHPYVWTEKDYDELINSHKLFARKFSISESPGIMQMLYEHIVNG